MILDSKQNPLDSTDDTARQRPPPYGYPGEPSNFKFTDWAQNSMFLVQAHNHEPLYRITVELDLNPFLPASYTTRIYRLGGHDAEAIGEFAISLNEKRRMLRLGDIAGRMDKVFFSIDHSPKHFNWVLANRLHWDCRSSQDDGSPICVCYVPTSKYSRDPRIPMAKDDGIPIAQFIPPSIERSPPLPDAMLTVFPYGLTLMDEIVMSALVVARTLTR